MFIGGRSGVGKSTVGAEVHEQLTRRDVAHAFIEGDNLDMAHPPPWEHQLAEKNLAAMWNNYRSLGYRHLVYTNTVSVLVTDDLVEAMGDKPSATAVLLCADDDTARERLSQREIGTALAWHVQRSDHMAQRLEAGAPPWVHRVNTAGRAVVDIADEIICLTAWGRAS